VGTFGQVASVFARLGKSAAMCSFSISYGLLLLIWARTEARTINTVRAMPIGLDGLVVAVVGHFLLFVYELQVLLLN